MVVTALGITEESLSSLSIKERSHYDSCDHEWEVMCDWHPVYLPNPDPDEDGGMVSELVERNLQCKNCRFVSSEVIDGSCLENRE